jgi:hypothetical protein
VPAARFGRVRIEDEPGELRVRIRPSTSHPLGVASGFLFTGILVLFFAAVIVSNPDSLMPIVFSIPFFLLVVPEVAWSAWGEEVLVFRPGEGRVVRRIGKTILNESVFAMSDLREVFAEPATGWNRLFSNDRGFEAWGFRRGTVALVLEKRTHRVGPVLARHETEPIVEAVRARIARSRWA